MCVPVIACMCTVCACVHGNVCVYVSVRAQACLVHPIEACPVSLNIFWASVAV